MKKKPDTVRRNQAFRRGRTLGLMLLLCAAVRLPLIGINESEYTDGVLQLVQFTEATGIYPPIYTALCWLVSWIMPPMWAGRVVSTAFGILGVVPIYLIALRCFGMKAALYAAMVYAFAPMAIRWSPRVMTETTFCFFFWMALERLLAAQSERSSRTAAGALMHAGLLGAVAALTRYQGLLIAPLVGLMALWRWRRDGIMPWRGVASLAAFALVPAWSLWAGNIHGEQFAERVGDSAVMTILLNIEPFVLILPYWLTYPVALACMTGLSAGHWRPRANPLWLLLAVMAVILPVQAAFGSFQERYLLPFVGLLFVYAGVGLAVVDERLRHRRPRLRPYAPILCLTWSAVVAVLVLAGSRQAFGDLARAAKFAASQPGRDRILTNEIYRAGRNGAPDITANKVRLHAGGTVEYIDMDVYTGRSQLRPGDLLVMSSAYGAREQLAMLGQRYRLEELGQESAVVTPIFADIMERPGTAQNPLAWMFRYEHQHFTTSVWRVIGPR